MYSNKIDNLSDYIPVSLSEIEALEKEINITFPNYFKEFLLQFNGATPVNNIYDGRAVSSFMALDHEEGYKSIKKNLAAMQNNNFYYGIYIPFADDISGQVFYLKITEPGEGKVVIHPFD